MPSGIMHIRHMAAALLFAANTDVFAQHVPMDEQAFSKVAAERIQQELPNYQMARTTQLTLEGKRRDGMSTGQMSLDRVYAFCQRSAENCSAALDQFAKGMSEAVKERDRPIQREMVRIAVRPAEYVEQLTQQLGPASGALFSRPVAHGLVAIPVLDYTRTVRFASQGDLQRLGLMESTLFSVGEENLRSSIKPLPQVTPTPSANSVGSITGEDYASSRMLFHADWGEVAERLNGNLVVMIPAPDILLYGSGSTPFAVEALRTLGVEMAKRSPRPLSVVVFRWDPTGWQEVK
jgi:hypothetical protein